MDDRLKEHWAELHKNMHSRILLQAHVWEHQSSLGSMLIMDCAGKPFQDHGFASEIVGRVDEFCSGEGKIEAYSKYGFKVYNQSSLRPLREMMLSRDHVEKRLGTAAAGPSYPTGEIHRLVDQCDWQSLAAAVFNDRETAAVVFRPRPLDPKFWGDRIGKTVLRKIDDTKDKYFAELSGPTTHTLTKHAREFEFKESGS
ncbi:hypothetical protein diail_10952 [Diaporthe ilicicola]|nr:hypothetical protein diail_10952 [Diaporthe ilicicola]